MWSEILIGCVSVPVVWGSIFHLGKWSSRVRINKNIKDMEIKKEDLVKEIDEQKEALDLLDRI